MDLKQIPDLTGKNVAIIGWPSSGKTFLSKELAELYPDHKIFHTDDYMNLGYRQSMYQCMEDVLCADGSTIVEGVQCYRMLRKGVEKSSYYPDVIIEIKIDEFHLEKVYSDERSNVDIDHVYKMIRNNRKVFEDYLKMDNYRKPLHVVVENNFLKNES